MKISYNWLQQFLQITEEASKIGELLTDLGLEVEGIQTKESIKGSLAGIVVGATLSLLVSLVSFDNEQNCQSNPGVAQESANTK